MAEPIANAPSPLRGEPELRRAIWEPNGVLRKNLKPMLYLGAAGLVIAAAVFSATGKKTAAQKGTSANQPPQPMLQDSTDNNVKDLKNQVAAQQKAQQAGTATDPTLQNATPAQQAAAAAYGPNGQPVLCAPGQPCLQQPGESMQQLSPAQQEEQQLAARDRELTFDSRFASNIVYKGTADQTPQQERSAALAENEGAPHTQQSERSLLTAPDPAASSLIAPRAAADPPAAQAAQAPAQRRPEVNIDAATGQPYVIYEGTTLDTVLMNRLDGDAPGPVKGMRLAKYRVDNGQKSGIGYFACLAA